ncbi:ANKRD13C [Cordylochernes scorpioides]|uniref:ANKRD13C n=1 Tax=Cordylochernes scorpioides TaxID=51811 RepID=A0ABY6KNE5_9ARAC|nr:ANKRD13C [Cordylochernes scorpioides]
MPQRRRSLPPPPNRRVSWEEYISGVSPPYLGRKMVCKESCKNFKATLAMCEDFPLSVDALLNVLEVITPFKHFNKLRKFVKMRLPSGFPIKIDVWRCGCPMCVAPDVPILPTVTARITFQDFNFRDNLPDSLFEISPDYKEDPSRFPEL